MILEQTNHTLAICMIVKDEEACLARCLQSLAYPSGTPIWDELIVVDTGSTDKTVEIAQKFGATLMDCKWKDDYSAPRNVGLNRATSDYIFIIDADEMLSVEGRDALNVIKRDGMDCEAYRIVTRNYMLESGHANEFSNSQPQVEEAALYPVYCTTTTTRLFHNVSCYRYSGEIHNALEPSITKANAGSKECIFCQHDTLEVHHFGYVDDSERRKKMLPMKLACSAKKAANQSDNPQAHYEYALAARDCGGHDDLYKAKIKESVQLLGKQGASCAKSFWEPFYELGIIQLAADELEEAYKAFATVINLNPPSPDSLSNMGVIQARLGEFDKALHLFGLALLHNQTPQAYLSISAVLHMAERHVEAVLMLDYAMVKHGVPKMEELKKQCLEALQKPELDTAQSL